MLKPLEISQLIIVTPFHSAAQASDIDVLMSSLMEILQPIYVSVVLPLPGSSAVERAGWVCPLEVQTYWFLETGYCTCQPGLCVYGGERWDSREM